MVVATRHQKHLELLMCTIHDHRLTSRCTTKKQTIAPGSFRPGVLTLIFKEFPVTLSEDVPAILIQPHSDMGPGAFSEDVNLVQRDSRMEQRTSCEHTTGCDACSVTLGYSCNSRRSACKDKQRMKSEFLSGTPQSSRVAYLVPLRVQQTCA